MVTSPPPPPRLFHYQRYVAEYLDTLLTRGTVKLSRPDNFNDPWDCRLRYVIPGDDAERLRVVRWCADMHRKHQPSTSEAKRALLAFNLQSDPAKLEAAILEMERQMYAAICKQYRVYCLAEKPDSQLMWSHYAQSHTGLCLEFDTSGFPFRASTKVEYRAEYPTYDLPTIGYEPLVAKSVDWSYEAEWRLIAEERGFAQSDMTVKTDDDFLLIPRDVLRSITIGMRADEPTRTLIRKTVQAHAPHVLVRQAERAPDRYEVKLDPPIQ